jgi:hypothetical protein
MDALYFYRRRIAASGLPVKPVRVGVIEREVDFAPRVQPLSRGLRTRPDMPLRSRR